jgi:DNA polymerase delta subunit 1
MATAVVNPPKRVLADSTDAYRNQPAAPKRRKLDGYAPSSSQTRRPGPPGSSQPKSQFEEEVLEKLSQDINGLKENNSEKDQEWSRPPLKDFNPHRDNLIFQQIDAEDGTLPGGRIAVRLFGVTEVCTPTCFPCSC